jgi:hypothetical protein
MSQLPGNQVIGGKMRRNLVVTNGQRKSFYEVFEFWTQKLNSGSLGMPFQNGIEDDIGHHWVLVNEIGNGGGSR